MVKNYLDPLRARQASGTRKVERRLAAVLGADIKGYSILMAGGEEDTHSRVGAAMARLTRQIERFSGRVFSFAGDGLMAEFPSAVDAMRCALRVQADAWQRNAKLALARRIELRLGVNSGDIVVQDGRMGGDTVNIAARLEQIAEPGGIFLSGGVFEQVSRAVPARYYLVGDVVLRNISHPVAIYRIDGSDCAPVRGSRRAVLPAAPASVGVEYRPSLAVLPFRSLQEDQGDAYFAEGMVDEIIHALGSLRELLVIARSSTLGYARMPVDLRRVGTELGVRYVLHGSVRRVGERLRISAELTEAETGCVLWANRFDGLLSELFELQERISLQVVATIAPQVRERELRRTMRKRPDNMTAYDLLLQALGLFHRADRDASLRTGELLRQAMLHDPDYAPAYSYASRWHQMRISRGWSTDPDADSDAALALATAAIERDPNDATALATFGLLQSYLRRDYDCATDYLERALVAGPNCAHAWASSSLTCGYQGDFAKAIERAAYAVRLSPLSPELFLFEHCLSQSHYLAGHFEEAVVWGRRSLGRNVNIANLRALIASLVAGGHTEDARVLATRLMILTPDFGLRRFAARTPLPSGVRERFVEQLKLAGLPD